MTLTTGTRVVLITGYHPYIGNTLRKNKAIRHEIRRYGDVVEQTADGQRTRVKWDYTECTGNGVIHKDGKRTWIKTVLLKIVPRPIGGAEFLPDVSI